MLGRQHLMMSVATVAIFLAPYIQEAEALVMVMFIGAGIGSLIPDVDAPDAAVFHNDVRGLNKEMGEAINNLIGPLLPVFGYTTKYLIYKPSVFFFDNFVFDDYSLEEKHRAFSHSFLGVFTMAAVTGVLMVPILIVAELFAPLYLLGFLSAYIIGAFLHMLEDSCTKTGIAWNSPFSQKKLKGNISTGKDIKKPRWFLYYLGTLAIGSLFLTSSTKFTISDMMVTAASVILVPLSWLVFVKGIARARFDG